MPSLNERRRMALLMVKMIGRIWYWPFPPQGPSFCRQISIRYLEILWQKWGKENDVEDDDFEYLVFAFLTTGSRPEPADKAAAQGGEKSAHLPH